MDDVINATIENGEIHIELNYRSIWPRGLSLSIGAGEETFEELAITSQVAKGGVQNILQFELPVAELVKHHALHIRFFKRKKILAEKVIRFKQSDREHRPIVVSNRRPEGLRLQGWIVPKAETPARLSLFIDGIYVESTAPTTVRRDILQMYPETGSTKNGYGLGIPEWAYDGKTHEFVIIEEHSQVIAENTSLTLSSADLREGLLRRSHRLLTILSDQLYEDIA